MKKSRFSEEKIIAILKELEAGVKAPELARKHGVSEATFVFQDHPEVEG
jgi:putative transposase